MNSSPHPRTAARRAAIEALVAVERDGAVLNAALERGGSAPFARELAAGVMRNRALIDWTLASLLKKPLEKLDAPIRAILRCACLERAWLQTPPQAVGNEYAGLARALKLSSASGLVNAIARRLPDTPRTPPSEKKAALHLATKFSHPQWLVERWLKRLGFDECGTLLEANNQRAALAVRVNDLKTSRDEVRSNLAALELNVRESELSPLALLVEDAGSPLNWPQWTLGEVIAQDEAAQLVSIEAAPQPGQTVLDLCAAPGGKSTHCAQIMKNEGRVVACDVAPGRVKLITQNAERLGLSIIEPRTADALAVNEPQADVVLLDAPCLGSGTLRRRPEARWNKTPEQLCELVGLQRALLTAAARLVKPGGILIYSTCSLEAEENSEQAAWFLTKFPDWRGEPQEFLPALRTPEGWLQTWPHRDGCDGMFCARFRAPA
ncbi:MAG TPA: 16S rRNA (cytosine(967)-C(5))-methyltransferase RsmB [Abditibacteriaceae bacterium]|jgi:16S rRNA (cytosine967-C5)-methyltransferase